MKSYVKRNLGPAPEYFRAMSPLCIQDPFDLSHNLTKACDKGVVDKLKLLCNLSAIYLSETLWGYILFKVTVTFVNSFFYFYVYILIVRDILYVHIYTPKSPGIFKENPLNVYKSNG